MNDQAIINDVISKGIFLILASKYYLTDARYVCSDITLLLYRGYRYYLKEGR